MASVEAEVSDDPRTDEWIEEVAVEGVEVVLAMINVLMFGMDNKGMLNVILIKKKCCISEI